MEYKQLNLEQSEIRLVNILQQGAEDGLIHCELQHVSLMRPPDYAALSYCWGDPNITSEIIMNGQSFAVTINLYAALSRLKTTPLRALWIDAICINQKDLVEKSAQLLLMGSIYRKASTTIAWLADLTFNHNNASPETFTSPICNNKEAEDNRAERLLQSSSILNNSYWRRVWIIQELALSQAILLFWTEGSIEFSHFQLATKSAKDLSQASKTVNMDALSHVWKVLQFRSDVVQEQPLSFFDALIRSQTSLATDVRDKVFALLNMTYNGNRYVPVANYSQSPRDLCLDITLEALKTTKSLDLLVLFATSKSASWPSWLPNWVSLSDTDGGLSLKFDYALRKMSWPADLKLYLHKQELAVRLRPVKICPWRANRDSFSGLNRHGAAVRIRGFFIASAQLSCLSSDVLGRPGSVPESPTAQIPLHYKSYYDRSNHEISLAKQTKVLFQRLFFVLAVLGDWQVNDVIAQKDDNLWVFRSWWPTFAVLKKAQYPELYAWFERNQDLPLWGHTLGYWIQCQPRGKMEEMLRDGPKAMISGPRENSYPPFEIADCLQKSLDWGMRFVVTQDGHIGWADPRARAGDQIAVLVGCSIPVILRPREEGGWRIVGGCFIHGYMEDEFFDTELQTWEDIEIY